MRKFIITAELRKLEGQVSSGEISYSKMIELLNEKAEDWHKIKLSELKKEEMNSKAAAIEIIISREDAFLDMAMKYKKEYEQTSWWKFSKRLELKKDWHASRECAMRIGLRKK